MVVAARTHIRDHSVDVRADARRRVPSVLMNRRRQVWRSAVGGRAPERRLGSARGLDELRPIGRFDRTCPDQTLEKHNRPVKCSTGCSDPWRKNRNNRHRERRRSDIAGSIARRAVHHSGPDRERGSRGRNTRRGNNTTLSDAAAEELATAPVAEVALTVESAGTSHVGDRLS